MAVGRGRSPEEEEPAGETVPPIKPLFLSSLLLTVVDEVEGLRGDGTTGKYDFRFMLKLDARRSMCGVFESLRESGLTVSVVELGEFDGPKLISVANDTFERPA